MLQINVSQQLKSPIGTVRNYDVDGLVEMEGADSSVSGKVQLMRTDKGILVKGAVETDSEQTCGRCLSGYNSHLVLKIEEEYFPVLDINGITQAPRDPGNFTIDERNTLDLTEAIRQYAVLARPMKPLCREDCSGLCPTCGVNLNQTTCNCPKQPVDPRWSILVEMLDNKDE